LGINEVLIKQVPFLRGQENKIELREMRNVIYSLNLMFPLVFALLLFILFLLTRLYGVAFDGNIMLCLALAVLSSQFRNFLFSSFYADKMFDAIARLQLMYSFLCGASMVLFVHHFSFIGAVVGLLISNGIMIVFMFMRYQSACLYRFVFQAKKIYDVLTIGAPLQLMLLIKNSYYYYASMAAVFFLLGTVQFGLYSFATAVLMATGFTAKIGAYIFPKLSERFGAKASAEEMQDLLYVPVALAGCCMTIGAGVLYVGMPWFILRVLPQYAESVGCARAIIIGVPFLAISILAQRYLVAVNKYKQCFEFLLWAAMVKVVCAVAVLTHGGGIFAVSIADS
jgi:O-antigen/teichoic acid export membrane protein